MKFSAGSLQEERKFFEGGEQNWKGRKHKKKKVPQASKKRRRNNKKERGKMEGVGVDKDGNWDLPTRGEGGESRYGTSKNGKGKWKTWEKKEDRGIWYTGCQRSQGRNRIRAGL